MKRVLALCIIAIGFFWVGVGFWYLAQPKIIVVPHHNVVATIRHKLLDQLSRRRLMTKHIILISTDHFSKNQHQILTTSPNDLLFPAAAADNTAVYVDHGILNILPDVRKVFPQASIYPLMIGNEVRITELEPLLMQIQSNCGIDCIVIASVDFSHYLPTAAAMTHDAYSIKTLENLDITAVWKTETDSPQALWLAIQLAEHWSVGHWTTYAQTNSSVIINDPWFESTSHVFGWYQAGSSRKRQDLKSFTIINATSSAGLAFLGNRLTYGTDWQLSSCTIPSINEMVITGWETKNTLYIGLLPITLTPKGYVWQRQFVVMPPISGCQKKVVLLPGTVNR